MEEIFLILGSNMGDRHEYIRRAIELISLRAGMLEQCSALYETEPWGFSAEQNFLNRVVRMRSDIPPRELLQIFQTIEKELGRVRGEERYTSRCIDIDILFYGNEVIHLPDLIIPHAGMAHRKFVLVPLAEIAGKKIHPLLRTTVNNMLETCPDACRVKKLNE